MSRKPRQKSVSGLYHVMLRGVNRKEIFLDDADHRKFISVILRAKIQAGAELYAYCLMGNHVHLLLKEGKEPLGATIKRVGVSYANYFNWKYQCVGHLFQGRFRSEPVEDDAYFISVLRYICQNPVKAGLCREPADYAWLGCAGLMGGEDLDRMDSLVPCPLAGLKEFINEDPGMRHMDDLEDREGDDAAVRRIRQICECGDVSEIAHLDKASRDEAIRKIRDAGISIRQAARLTGIGKATIERVLSRKTEM